MLGIKCANSERFGGPTPVHLTTRQARRVDRATDVGPRTGLLVVDDEPLVVSMLVDLLSDGPYTIETATAATKRSSRSGRSVLP